MENQTKLNTSLILKKEPIEFIKPSKQIPFEALSLSTLDNDPHNEVMYGTIHVFKANENIQEDPVALLKKALSELLVYYYPLSGKLMRRKTDRKLRLICRGEGVPFEVATAVHDDLLSLNYVENIDEKTALLLVPEIEFDYDSEIGYHPLALQVTKFSCGGFTIGTALSHAVCDGFGVAKVIYALTEMAQGRSEPSVLPVWQRERLVEKIDDKPARVPGGDVSHLLASSPYMQSNDIEMVTETINIKAETIKSLKDNMVKELELPKENFTTFEVLSAFTWKSRSKALKLNPDGINVLGIAVGIRHVLDPPLTEGYYGNAYIDVCIEKTTRELDELSIYDVAKLVKNAKNTAYDKDYVKEELTNRERLLKEDVEFEGLSDGLLFLTDWRNIGWFGSMDFGWGEPMNLRPLIPSDSSKIMGTILKPSKLDPLMEGGVKVVMTLPKDAMLKFKQEVDDINKLLMI